MEMCLRRILSVGRLNVDRILCARCVCVCVCLFSISNVNRFTEFHTLFQWRRGAVEAVGNTSVHCFIPFQFVLFASNNRTQTHLLAHPIGNKRVAFTKLAFIYFHG